MMHRLLKEGSVSPATRTDITGDLVPVTSNAGSRRNLASIVSTCDNNNNNNNNNTIFIYISQCLSVTLCIPENKKLSENIEVSIS
jgi:hypothetical protein